MRTVESACFSRIITERKENLIPLLIIEEDNSYREHKNPEDEGILYDRNMMNYEIFKEVVKEKFMDYMPEKFKGMELVAEPVEKVNVTLDGIILREEGRNISPTIYINDMYKKYQDCGDLEVSHH